MGLLDKFKDAAGDLVQGAKVKVTDVTGVDTGKLFDAAGNLIEAGRSLTEAAEVLHDDKPAS